MIISEVFWAGPDRTVSVAGPVPVWPRLPPPPSSPLFLLLLRSDGHIPRYLSPPRNPELTANQRGQTPGQHGKTRPDLSPGLMRV